MTNRDLYLFVRNLKQIYQNAPNQALEAYLSALWKLVATDRPQTPTIEQLARWLEAAFSAEVLPFNPQWLDVDLNDSEEYVTYNHWENLILSQIADLHRMKEAGIFENEYRYFGMQSPGGAYWYNFDPLTYLECAIRGKYGGYEAEEVVVLIPPAEGESADSPIYRITSFTWEDFADILEFGQFYE